MQCVSDYPAFRLALCRKKELLCERKAGRSGIYGPSGTAKCLRSERISLILWPLDVGAARRERYNERQAFQKRNGSRHD